uniref:Zinc finger matrin-type protein 5 n=1 Tax=Cairina moschata TaxID=8855 RepID=A0A8C3CCH7_CAIMO
MGKRYFCDYCDRSFQDNLHNRKKHLNGVQHLRAKRAWYDLFRDAAAILQEEQSKKPCRKFLQTGQCDFGANCRFSHMTEQDLEKLSAQVQGYPHEEATVSTVSGERGTSPAATAPKRSPAASAASLLKGTLPGWRLQCTPVRSTHRQIGGIFLGATGRGCWGLSSRRSRTRSAPIVGCKQLTKVLVSREASAPSLSCCLLLVLCARGVQAAPRSRPGRELKDLTSASPLGAGGGAWSRRSRAGLGAWLGLPASQSLGVPWFYFRAGAACAKRCMGRKDQGTQGTQGGRGRCR